MPLTKVQSRGTENVGQGSSNVIINGAMNVAQRSSSETALGANTDTYRTVDRFKLLAEGSNSGRLTMSQDSSAPSGFANSLKLDCTTADTSIGSSELLTISQIIEGQNVQHFAKGTSSAKQYAVSFYVKGNASATYVAELFDADNSRHVCKTFSVTTDWTRVEMIFPADTSGAFNDDNGESLRLQIFLHAGSDFTSGTLPSTWASKTNANRAVGISSFFDSTDRTFFLTGVQLEVGSQVSDFQHEDFGTTLSKCLRYTFVHQTDTAYAYSALSGYCNSTSSALTFYQFPVRMRTTPSLTTNGTFHMLDGHSAYDISNMSISEPSPISSRVDVTVSGATVGRVATVRNKNDSDAQIIFNSEL